MTELAHLLIALLISTAIPLLMCWLIMRVAMTWPVRSPSSRSGSKGKTTVSGGGGGGGGNYVSTGTGTVLIRGNGPPLPWAHRPAPDLPIEDAGVCVGEIVGWRVWRSTWGYLHSAVRADIWPPGEPMSGDVTRNGVHAWKTQRAALQYASDYTNGRALVVGRVHLWGTVIEHERGYRAEYAKIISLELVYPCDHETIAMLIDLRETYGLDESTPSA